MSDINFEQYIGLLIQVPLVGIFIWFTLKIVDRFLSSLDSRDKQWQEFLKDQRTETNQALTNLTADIKALTADIKANTGAVAQIFDLLFTRESSNKPRARKAK